MSKEVLESVISLCKSKIEDKRLSSKLSSYELSELGRDIGLPHYDSAYQDISNEEANRVVKVFYKTWLCTDTQVGKAVYFLDGDAIAFSNQSGRKMDEEFTFISQDKVNVFKKYLLDLLDIETTETPELDDTFFNNNPDDDIFGYYRSEYASQIFHKYVLAMENGEIRIAEIIKKSNYWTEDAEFEDQFHDLKVKFLKSGKTAIVKSDNTLIQYGQGFDELPELP